MRIFAFILCLFSFSAGAQCEPDCQKHGKRAIVEGRIIIKNGEPAAGLKLKINTEHGCPRTSVTTDAYGTYKIDLAEGRYEFATTYKTGTEDSKKVIVYKGEKVRVDFDEKRIKRNEVLKVSEEEDEPLN